MSHDHKEDGEDGAEGGGEEELSHHHHHKHYNHYHPCMIIGPADLCINDPVGLGFEGLYLVMTLHAEPKGRGLAWAI